MTGSNGERDAGGDDARRARWWEGRCASDVSGAPRTGPERVIVYTKRGCGWCYEVLSLLDSRGIVYEEREVYGNRRYFDEMVEKSGQWLAPVVEIDGHLLIDTDAYEVGRYLAQLADRPAAE